MNKINICDDVMVMMLSLLNLKDLRNFFLTCKYNNKFSNNNVLWMDKLLKIIPNFKEFCISGVNFKGIIQEITLKGESHLMSLIFNNNHIINYGKIKLTKSKNLNKKNNITNIFNNISKIGNLEITKALLLPDNAKKINIKGIGSRLFYASAQKNPDYFKFLMDYSYKNKGFLKPGIYSLYYATQYHHIDIIKLIFEYYDKFPDKKIYGLIQKYFNNTIAKNRVSIDMLNLYVDLSYKYPKIIDFGASGNELLISSCSNGNLDVLKKILDYAEKQPDIINFKINDNQIFITAFRYNQKNVVQLLLDFYEKYPNTMNIDVNNYEILSYPIRIGRAEIFEILLTFFEKNQTKKIIDVCKENYKKIKNLQHNNFEESANSDNFFINLSYFLTSREVIGYIGSLAKISNLLENFMKKNKIEY
jgi:hypothetical protein